MTKDRHRHGSPLAGACLLAALLGFASPGTAVPAGRGVEATLAEAVQAEPATVRRLLHGRRLRAMDGSDASLASRPGEVVVVNFWATWCRPCLRELPALGRLHAEIASRGGRVVAVAIDTDARKVQRFAAAHELTVPVVHDGPAGLVRQLDLKAVPLTLVLDRHGDVAWASTRSDEAGLAETRAAVLRLLDAPVPTPSLAGESEGGGR